MVVEFIFKLIELIFSRDPTINSWIELLKKLKGRFKLLLSMNLVMMLEVSRDNGSFWSLARSLIKIMHSLRNLLQEVPISLTQNLISILIISTISSLSVDSLANLWLRRNLLMPTSLVLFTRWFLVNNLISKISRLKIMSSINLWSGSKTILLTRIPSLLATSMTTLARK